VNDVACIRVGITEILSHPRAQFGDSHEPSITYEGFV
jgi:hypothetical protein